MLSLQTDRLKKYKNQAPKQHQYLCRQNNLSPYRHPNYFSRIGSEPFNYKAKLFEKTEADRANRILRNTTIVVPYNYLSNIWGLLKMP